MVPSWFGCVSQRECPGGWFGGCFIQCSNWGPQPAAPLGQLPLPQEILQGSFLASVSPTSSGHPFGTSDLGKTRTWVSGWGGGGLSVAPNPGTSGRVDSTLNGLWGLGWGTRTQLPRKPSPGWGAGIFPMKHESSRQGSVGEQNSKGRNSQRWARGCGQGLLLTLCGEDGSSLWQPVPLVAQSRAVSGPLRGSGMGLSGQDRKFFHGPEIFEPVIVAITAGWRCELEFKRSLPKALSSLSAANWKLPQAARTCPDSWAEPACGFNVMQMAGIFPCGS